MLSSTLGLTQRPEHRITPLRTAGLAFAGAAALALLPSSVSAFATIPEEEVVSREGQRDLIHIRVQQGCADEATEAVATARRRGLL